MTRLKRVYHFVGLILFSFLLLMFWYKINYSMEVADSFEVKTPNQERELLIATQGSDFKEAIVNGVISAFKGKPVYIKVIDVRKLSSIKIED